MRKILSILVILIGCSLPTAAGEQPTVNIPPPLRQRNWLGSQGEGSCVHASMISLFRWQGRPDLADWWRTHQGNGEWAEDLAAKLDAKGVRFAYVTNGDVRFLEWAIRTRRGCGVTVMGGAHMVDLVHLDAQWACLLDNNSPNQYKWVPRATFIAEWKNSLGWAVTPVYSPAPPLPH